HERMRAVGQSTGIRQTAPGRRQRRVVCCNVGRFPLRSRDRQEARQNLVRWLAMVTAMEQKRRRLMPWRLRQGADELLGRLATADGRDSGIELLERLGGFRIVLV